MLLIVFAVLLCAQYVLFHTSSIVHVFRMVMDLPHLPILPILLSLHTLPYDISLVTQGRFVNGPRLPLLICLSIFDPRLNETMELESLLT